MVRPADLPTFSNPPIDEVAIGVFFEPAGASPDLVAFRLFEKFQQRAYDGFEVKLPLMLDEDHPEAPIAPPDGPPTTMITTMAPLPNRYWITSNDNTRIVQLQSDAFYINWRRQDHSDYPHFEILLEEFQLAKALYLATLSEMNSSPPEVKVMEVMNVNWIVDPVDEWFKPAEGGRLSGRHADARPEGYAWQARYPIRQGGARIGRLKAESQTAVRLVNETWQEGSQFSLRARFAANGALNEADLEPMLYIGNQSIVQAFKDLTTAAAHERWELVQ